MSFLRWVAGHILRNRVRSRVTREVKNSICFEEDQQRVGGTRSLRLPETLWGPVQWVGVCEWGQKSGCLCRGCYPFNLTLDNVAEEDKAVTRPPEPVTCIKVCDFRTAWNHHVVAFTHQTSSWLVWKQTKMTFMAKSQTSSLLHTIVHWFVFTPAQKVAPESGLVQTKQCRCQYALKHINDIINVHQHHLHVTLDNKLTEFQHNTQKMSLRADQQTSGVT